MSDRLTQLQDWASNIDKACDWLRGQAQVYPGHQAVPPTSHHVLEEWSTLSPPPPSPLPSSVPLMCSQRLCAAAAFTHRLSPSGQLLWTHKVLFWFAAAGDKSMDWLVGSCLNQWLPMKSTKKRKGTVTGIAGTLKIVWKENEIRVKKGAGGCFSQF